jgi:hypothetical protein
MLEKTILSNIAFRRLPLPARALRRKKAHSGTKERTGGRLRIDR